MDRTIKRSKKQKGERGEEAHTRAGRNPPRFFRAPLLQGAAGVAMVTGLEGQSLKFKVHVLFL